MKSDTRINVGAVIGMGMLLVTIIVFQSGTTNARIDRLDSRFDGLDDRFDRLEGRFDGLDSRFDRLEGRFDGLEGRVDGLDSRFDRTDSRIGVLEAQVDGLRSDMREDHAAINSRLDAMQSDLSEVAQRLSHVEGRLGMPRGGDTEGAPGG